MRAGGGGGQRDEGFYSLHHDSGKIVTDMDKTVRRDNVLFLSVPQFVEQTTYCRCVLQYTGKAMRQV